MKGAARFAQAAVAALLSLTMLFSGALAEAILTDVDAVVVLAAPLTKQSSAVNGMVRVYLSSLGNPSSLNLTIAGNYSVNGDTSRSLSSGTSVTVGFSSSTGAITLTQGGTKYNMGTYFALRRHSASGANGVRISQAKEPGNAYPGDISFRAVPSGGSYKLYTVAHIYIENYLYGVLPYEMGNSTSIEALKAQAVAARTYTVRMMNARASGYYDVVDTTNDQVYRGTPSGNANCVSAVDATKGVVLKYGSAYAMTYYSASNGGQTESAKNAWGYSGYDYLTVRDDPFDYSNSSSTVKKTTIAKNLSGGSGSASLTNLLKTKAVAALKSKGYSATADNTALTTLTGVTPHTPKYSSPSRLYTKMDFTLRCSVGGASATVTVTCDIFSELESALSMSIQSSKNELWSVKSGSTAFTLEARRYGHGIGMSQRGAMYMAKLGYSYDEILGFYYVGVKRVQISFTNTILSAVSGETETVVETPADIDDGDDTCKGTVKLVGASSSIAIRSAKSTSGGILGTAGNGAIMTVLANDGTWCFVKYGELQGYLPANALTITGTPGGAEGTPSSIEGFATVTASDFVNLRESGNMSARVVSTAPSGAVMTVFSRSGSWAKAQYCATVAYVNTGYVSITASYPSATSSTGSATAVVQTEDGTGTVNLRASASTTAQALAAVAVGERVTVSSDDGSWATVSYGGITGYMLSAFLRYDGESLDPSEETPGGSTDDPSDGSDPSEGGEGDETGGGTTATVTTVSGSLNLRAEARAGSVVITTIPRLARIGVTSVGATWCGVSYNGYSGYAMTCFLTIDGQAVSRPSDGQEATVATQSGSLNLRAEGRAGSQIITTIPQHAAVMVNVYGAEWCNVTYSGVTGYVMTVFLAFGAGAKPDDGATDEPTDQPTDDPGTDAPADEPTKETTDGALYAVVTTASGSLNLRREAMTGSDVLARIPRGTTLAISQKLAAWSLTSYAGQTGYVMNAFLTFSQAGQSVTGDGDEGATEGAAEGETDALTAVVTTASGSLNLRDEPSSNGGVILRIPRFATVSVQERGDAWCRVAYGTSVGYAMTQFLAFSAGGGTGDADGSRDADAEAPSADEPTVRAATVATQSGSLNLRESAANGARVLTTIPRGGSVSVLRYGADWCHVAYGGYSGYVVTSFLRFVEVGTASGAGAVGESGEQAEQPQPGETDETNETIDTTVPDVAEPSAPAPDAPTGVDDSSGTALDLTLRAPDDATYAVVKPRSGDALPLWSQCSEKSYRVDDMPSGTQVEIILIGNDWCLVQYLTQQGYCLTSGLEVQTP